MSIADASKTLKDEVLCNVEKTFSDLEDIEGFGSHVKQAETPALKGIKIGAAIGSGAGAIYGGIIGGAIGFAIEHKKTAAVVITAVVAYKFRHEIADFVLGTGSGDSAGGDAFM